MTGCASAGSCCDAGDLAEQTVMVMTEKIIVVILIEVVKRNFGITAYIHI